MHRTQVALCYGTRPQVIKASVLRSRLEARYSVVAVDTGDSGGLQREAYWLGTPCVSALEPLVP